MTEVVIGELSNVERHIILGREDVVSFAVVIDKHRLVTRHLSAFEVTHEEHATLNLFSPFRRPPRLQLREEQLVAQVGRVGQTEADRIAARIDATRPHEAKRSQRTITDRHSSTGSFISPPFQLKMKPHHELLCLGVIEHLRPLDDATFLYVATGVVDGLEHKAPWRPVPQVLRSVAAHTERADRSIVAACLTIPIISATILENISSMRVDMFSARVFPQSSLHRLLPNGGEREEEGKANSEQRYLSIVCHLYLLSIDNIVISVLYIIM